MQSCTTSSKVANSPSVILRRRHENDDIAQRPDHHAAFARFEDDLMADPLLRRVTLPARLVLDELDADHIAPLADIADMSQRQKLVAQSLLQQSHARLHFLDDIFFGEQFEIGDGHRAAERVAGIGVAMEEGFEIFVLAEKRREDILRGERRRQRQITAGDAFGKTKYVRRHAGVVAGEHFPGAAKAGGDLVENEENPMAPAEITQRL